MTPLLVVLGAVLGGPARLWTTALLDRPPTRGWPRGTLAVNVAGSGLLGLFSALALADAAAALLGVGFCGTFTTYSAFAVQTHRLGRRGVAYAVTTLTTCIVAATIGAVAGGALT
ncbi:CrcB family protein [Nocardioides sp. R-C-SC26]|uniref:fluoride efflux transporter FluC n=1 Tax=Nocardioides sp. R-C-SC26 TaxID=2870414 RepID=UPI001E4B341F|nr:CrcB family protein [Nocardioides sp. R-C-SC26]